jgi:xylan 1,4-beta-xylosidase
MRRLTPVGSLLLIVALVAVLPDAAAQQPATYSNPIVAHDYPDPSAIRVGDDYWMVATAGGWAPIFTIRHSRDLVTWRAVGSVFDEPPAWADDDFWAPELVEHRGRYYVYYTARKRNGPLCVAVASAASPTGPYTDHGPLVCQEIGSIDADMAEGDDGELYLVWKEDGNSRGRPTPIWAQRLAADAITLTGEPKELIRNDVAWEGGVVEGTHIVKRDGWYYMFYSGNACCGRTCNYALGVARARAILGPWEKNPANPILPANAAWRCPGHGTLVDDKAGRTYLVYHASPATSDFPSTGRHALLDRVEWKADGWPVINDGRGPSREAPAPAGGGNAPVRIVADEFDGDRLDPSWRWPMSTRPAVTLESGVLTLAAGDGAPPGPLAAVLARPHARSTYETIARIRTAEMKAGSVAGVSAYSWRNDAVGIVAGDGKIAVWKRRRGRHHVVATARLPRATPTVHLRVAARDGTTYRFAYSRDGKTWNRIGGAVDGSYMEFVQLALTAGGAGRFESVTVTYPERTEAR